MAGFVSDDRVVPLQGNNQPGFVEDHEVIANERSEGKAESTGIGSAVLAIAGSVVGAVAGSVLGPLGTLLGGWLGGILGGIGGEVAEQAFADVFDDDDTTTWNRISEAERNKIVETALIEIFLGWIPGSAGAAVSRSAGKQYSKLVDKIKGVIGGWFSKAGAGGAGRIAGEVLDNHAANLVAKHIAKMSENDKRRILVPLIRKYFDSLHSIGARPTRVMKEELLTFDYGSVEALEKLFARLTSSPNGAAVIAEWYRSDLMKKIRIATGVGGLLRGLKADPTSQEDLGVQANRGGLIMRHPSGNVILGGM